MEFHIKLRTALAAAGLDGTALAAQVSVCKQTVNRWVHGRGRPALARRAAIAEAIGVSPEWLFGPATSDLLDLAEACRRAGISPRTVADWRWRCGRSLAVPEHAERFVELLVRIGGRWRIAESDLTRWLAEQRGAARRPLEGLDLLELQHATGQLAQNARDAGAEALWEEHLARGDEPPPVPELDEVDDEGDQRK